MTKVLITGGTGAIGMRLTRLLLENGHEVRHVSRHLSSKTGVPTFKWNLETKEIDPEAIKDVEVIMHLAGAGIADAPWTKERRAEIVDSRVGSAKLLFEACKKHGVHLKQFISASAIGWYPLSLSEKIHFENDPPGEGFLAEVCRQWEAAADQFEPIADSVAKIRIGLVLARGEGALKQIALPVQFYAAAGLGKGTQSMSWIHKTDVCRIFAHVMENELSGVYNGVGPEPISNKDFMQILADVMEKPMFLPNVPEFVIRLMFGEKAELVLRGVPISSEKIESTGFVFDYPTLNSALMQIYSEDQSS
jgi:uncharacterized protein (TIGR01777 family)